MPDQDTPVVNFELETPEGETTSRTEDEVTAMLNDEINVVEVTASFGISCQIKEFHPHTKHMSFKNEIRTSDVASKFKPEERKAINKMSSAMLFAKIAAQGAAAHRAMMTEFIKDGYDPNILPWRRGEKEKVMGNES